MSNPEAFERGLTARLLIFDPQIELKHDDGIVRSFDSEIIEEWTEFILSLLARRSPHLTHNVQCSSGAREVFRHFHNESIDLRLGQYVDIEGELSRRRENAVRIALNLWIADEAGDQLTEEQAKRAVEIVRWCYNSYLSLLKSRRINQMNDRLENLRGILIETMDKTVTLRDLATRNGYTAKEVENLASEFPDKLEIIEIPSGSKGGRPSKVARIPNRKLEMFTSFAGNAG